MNRHKAKRLTLKEMNETLPQWFVKSFDLTFKLLETNNFVDFKRIETFVKSSISHITATEDEKNPVKHILVELENKGIKDEYQYISTNVYVVTAESTWKIVKSCKVKLRFSLQKWD